MAQKRYVVMGAGEVGFHLARSLSQEGHNVAVKAKDGKVALTNGTTEVRIVEPHKLRH